MLFPLSLKAAASTLPIAVNATLKRKVRRKRPAKENKRRVA